MRPRVLALLLLLLAAPAAAAELVMFEQPGCPWCAQWDREIAPKLPMTAEGRRAPLRRVNLRGGIPPGLDLIAGVRFTPTFVLVQNGREVGRITGYAGEHFFWEQLEGLVRQLPVVAMP
jgi:protein-disulfide isomerase